MQIGSLATISYNKPQNMVSDPKPSGTPFKRNQEPMDQPQNPEKEQQEDEKSTIRTFWNNRTKVQKGLMISGAVLLVLMLVTGFTFLGLYLSWHPMMRVTNKETIPMPNNSKETIVITQVQSSNTKFLSSDGSFTATVVSIDGARTISRLLQQNSGQISPGFITVAGSSGISVTSQQPGMYSVQIDIPAVINKYAFQYLDNKRLLTEEIRLMQQNPNDNALVMDDPIPFQNQLEKQILRAVSKVIGSNQNQNGQLVFENVEMIDIVLQSDGTYQIEADITPQQNGRLLQVINQNRLLSEWQGIMSDMSSKIVEKEVAKAVQIIVKYGQDIAAAANVSYSAETQLKLAVQIPETDPNAASALLNIDGLQSRKPSMRRVKQMVKRKTKQIKNKIKLVSEEAYNSTVKCSGCKSKRLCKKDEVNSKKSPFFVNDAQTTVPSPSIPTVVPNARLLRRGRGVTVRGEVRWNGGRSIQGNIQVQW